MLNKNVVDKLTIIQTKWTNSPAKLLSITFESYSSSSENFL